jgi:putative component of toxin-antitoxin plasmid stabilization module
MVDIEIREYLDPQSRSPYARWFRRLNPVAAAHVVRALYRLAQGNFSNVKGVGNGVFEQRIDRRARLSSLLWKGW